jgi:hypothetical protein
MFTLSNALNMLIPICHRAKKGEGDGSGLGREIKLPFLEPILNSANSLLLKRRGSFSLSHLFLSLFLSLLIYKSKTMRAVLVKQPGKERLYDRLGLD